MTDPVDSMAPWTIKSIAQQTRDAITTAARKEGLTVGQWLEKRVREWTEDGGSVRVSDMGGPSVLELARLAGELSGDKETAVVRAARAAVLGLLAPHVPPGQKPGRTTDVVPVIPGRRLGNTADNADSRSLSPPVTTP